MKKMVSNFIKFYFLCFDSHLRATPHRLKTKPAFVRIPVSTELARPGSRCAAPEKRRDVLYGERLLMGYAIALHIK